MKTTSLLWSCFMVIGSLMGSAQERPREGQYMMSNTEVHYLDSNTNGVPYKLYVSLPESYEDSVSKKYPVLYLLDADYSFALAKNITDHLSQRNHMQEMIIVGIAYAGPDNYRVNRTRDYTPVNSVENVWFSDIQEEYSGGGPEFLAFIEKELIPYVDGSFRTTGFRALTGHSYGGLFASWTLFTKPHLFKGYIIVSPSLWYNDKMMFRLEDKLEGVSGPKKIYCAVGDREVNDQWNMPEDLRHFFTVLKNKGNPNIQVQLEVGDNETHNSIFPTALSNGLRFVFDGV